jgi:hypothetical protein
MELLSKLSSPWWAPLDPCGTTTTVDDDGEDLTARTAMDPPEDERCSLHRHDAEEREGTPRVASPATPERRSPPQRRTVGTHGSPARRARGATGRRARAADRAAPASETKESAAKGADEVAVPKEALETKDAAIEDLRAELARLRANKTEERSLQMSLANATRKRDELLAETAEAKDVVAAKDALRQENEVLRSQVAAATEAQAREAQTLQRERQASKATHEDEVAALRGAPEARGAGEAALARLRE